MELAIKGLAALMGVVSNGAWDPESPHTVAQAKKALTEALDEDVCDTAIQALQLVGEISRRREDSFSRAYEKARI